MVSGYLIDVLHKLERLREDERGPILAAIAGGWALTIGGRMIYPVLLPHLRRSYELDLAAAGFLLTILFLAYALGQLPGGVLADRVGERITLTLSLSIAVGALIFVILARSSFVLFVTTAMFGFGVGLYSIARFTAIANIFPEGYGTAIGITNSSSEIGQGILPPIAGILAVIFGWQLGFGFMIPLFVAIAVSLWLVVPERSPNKTSTVDSLSFESAQYVLSELRKPPIIRGTIILILGMTIWQAFTGFYPTYLIEEKEVSSSIASVIFGLYFVISALIHPISGAVYDRWNIQFVFLIIGISIFGFVSLPLIYGFWSLVAATVLLGSFMGFATATESYIINRLPHDMEGTGFGVLRTFSFMIGATSPIIFGVVAELGFFDEIFILLAILTFVLLTVGIRLPKN